MEVLHLLKTIAGISSSPQAEFSLMSSIASSISSTVKSISSSRVKGLDGLVGAELWVNKGVSEHS